MTDRAGRRDPVWRAAASFGLRRLYLPEGWLQSGTGGEPEEDGMATGAAERADGIRRDLARLREEIGDCTRCRLGETRNRLVFGDGNPAAGIVLVGEGPGANEDRTGQPFVGRAGQLLDRILAAIDLGRDSVYITNIVKCRPPKNRAPRGDEVTACLWMLEEQIRIMRPGVIVALGASAARTLTGRREGIGVLRGSMHSYMDVPLMATYHPAALLRSPALKKPVWDDIRDLRDFLDRSGLPRREG
ncbi:MAG: uracil-DNA glycosylase [Candidatus Fermentibacteraceae bacterium]